MPATNYTNPATGPYRLVRIRSTMARIMDPSTLDRILSVLESGGEHELWLALYRSQPFHSTTVDPSGSKWRHGNCNTHPASLPREFPWAAAQGLLEEVKQ